MNKKLILSFTFLIITILGFSQRPFGFSEKLGFGTPNEAITSMKTFKGKMYVAMGTMNGNIFRTSTGDPGSYTNVFNQLGFPKANNLAVTAEGAGYLFAGIKGSGMGARYSASANQVLSPPLPSKVVRSVDGITWEDYFELPAGGGSQLEITSITFFKGTGTVDSVYISYSNGSNTYIVRNSVTANDFINSATWQLVCDLSLQFGTPGEITSSAVFGGKLYYTTNTNRLYETADGVNFIENNNFSTSMGVSSLVGNNYITSIAAYNGNLYFGSYNNNGLQLRRTADGITFDSLYSNPLLYKLTNLTVVANKLWMLSVNGDYFRTGSYDGTSYTLEDSTEMGEPSLTVNNFAAINEFNNHVYIGSEQNNLLQRLGKNPTNNILNLGSTGGQIWRACLLANIPTVAINNGVDTTVCAGASVVLNAGSGYTSYFWQGGQTTQTITSGGPGLYTVSASDAIGCRNAAEYTVIYQVPINVSFADSANNSLLSTILVCKGSTTNSILALPEDDKFALKITGQDKGFITPGSTAFAARALTIEVWIKPTATSNGMILTEYDLAGTWLSNNHDILEYYGGTIYIELPGITEISIGSVPLNQWSHLALRYDGTTLNGFINGVLSGSVNTGTWGLPDSGSDAFKIGYGAVSGVGNAGSMKGSVRDLRIWNSARADIDIQNNMFALIPGSYPDLIYQYPLNEGTGSNAYDISGNNLHSVSVAGTFVSPQAVTITPAAGTINQGNNYYKFNPLQTTTYNASYINSTGCVVNTAFNVDVPKVTFTGSLPAVCGGIDASIYAATPGSYTITPSVIDANPYFTPSPQPVIPTWYYANGFSAAGGCAISDSILINVGPAFASNIGNPPPVNACEESFVTIDVIGSGGTAPYSYYWQKSGSPLLDTTSVDSLTFYIGSVNSSVYVTGKDANGCPMLPTVSFSIQPTISSTLSGQITTPPPSSLNVDNGYVYIFKHQPGNAGFDTIGYSPLDANGFYNFIGLYAGDYLIKALPDQASFPLSVPTYYGNAFQWDSSLVYTHGCVLNDTANIQIVEASAVTGNASISGYILEGDAFGANRYVSGGGPITPFVPGGPLKGIDVKLGKNPGGGIQARVSSDTTGYYVFDSVPVGGYKIYVDIPNLPMDSTRQLLISLGDSSVQNNYFADSASIYINPDTISSVGIYSSAKSYENKFSLYPNPAKDLLYVSYELEKEGKVAFEITNMFGQVLKYEQARKHPEGKNIFIFNIEQLNLSSGVYFISILNENKKHTQRVVVID